MRYHDAMNMMALTAEEAARFREEMRELRQRTARSERSAEQLREKARRLGQEMGEKQGEVKRLKEANQELKDENEKLKAQLAVLGAHRDTLERMIFKANTSSKDTGEETAQTVDKKKRGGQVGHTGHARKDPIHIDQEIYVRLSHCPDCLHLLPSTSSRATYSRIVEDIPEPTTVVTKYTIERKWCSHCQKEVCAIPTDTLPEIRYGQRTLSLILLLKYRLRTPLQKITELFQIRYGLHITPGGIQRLLHGLRERFRERYDALLKEVRASPVKHADETSWRVMGQNWWCWLFATTKSAVYAIRDTRGKGIPKKMLEASNPHSILVRDDYAGYKSLPLAQQSCWSHLLRVSHEATKQPDAQEETKQLHQELKTLFCELETTILRPFKETERKRLHTQFAIRIQTIIQRTYIDIHGKKVQTRIRNQGNNLITAILYPDVPLTNNHAERQIRPMAVTRKISGGSQSREGAETHAMNMSIVQSIVLQGKNFCTEMNNLLSVPAQRFVSERGE